MATGLRALSKIFKDVNRANTAITSQNSHNIDTRQQPNMKSFLKTFVTLLLLVGVLLIAVSVDVRARRRAGLLTFETFLISCRLCDFCEPSFLRTCHVASSIADFRFIRPDKMKSTGDFVVSRYVPRMHYCFKRVCIESDQDGQTGKSH
jgi:hypothetical protein